MSNIFHGFNIGNFEGEVGIERVGNEYRIVFSDMNDGNYKVISKFLYEALYQELVLSK